MGRWCCWFMDSLLLLTRLDFNLAYGLSSPSSLAVSSLSSSSSSIYAQLRHHDDINPTVNRVGRSWEIHKTIRELEEFGMPSSTYDTMTLAVLNVLRKWQSNILHDNHQDDTSRNTTTISQTVTVTNTTTTTTITTTAGWQSLLNKANLRHEVEESIVALHYLYEWALEQRHQHDSSSLSSSSFRFVAVDACCGKGVFSMLLTYIALDFFPDLDRIILLDKDTKINWNHIAAANQNCQEEHRPYLELWANTNLHDYDLLLDRFLTFDQPLALTGIHLCKTLSPTLIGLMNGLGTERAPYLCLAPCCLPRTSQKLSMIQYESPLQRNARRQAQKEQRNRRRQKQESFKCYVCQGNHHVRNCPQQQEYSSIHIWNNIVSTALLQQLPCPICGEMGHRPSNCCHTNQQSAKQQRHQPGISFRKEPSKVSLDPMMKAVAESQTPFETYCDLLSLTIQNTKDVRVIDSGLTSLHSLPLTSKRENHDKNHNWNQNRKSIYIVVTR